MPVHNTCDQNPFNHKSLSLSELSENLYLTGLRARALVLRGFTGVSAADVELSEEPPASESSDHGFFFGPFFVAACFFFT